MGEPRRLTPLALSALALLAERPMHPYEMFQLAVQRRDHRLVKIRPGTLYHAVARLAAEGYVQATGTERAGNRPERTTYEITGTGLEILRQDVTALLGEPEPEYPVFPFALSEAHNLPVDELTELLVRRRRRLEETVQELEQGIAGVRARDLPWAYWLHLEYLHAVHSAEARWLDAAVRDIAAGRFALPWTPASGAAVPSASGQQPSLDTPHTETDPSAQGEPSA